MSTKNSTQENNAQEQLMKGLSGKKVSTKNPTLDNNSPKQSPLGKPSKKKVSFEDQLSITNSTLNNNTPIHSSLGKSLEKKVSCENKLSTKNSTLENTPQERIWKSLPFILKKPTANRGTRKLPTKLNYEYDIFTDDSSMYNNVDTKENPLDNLPKKTPKGLASPMKNSQPNYQNFEVFAKLFSQNNSIRTMDNNLSSKEPQGTQFPNDSSPALENSPQKMPKISILKRTSNKSNYLPKNQNLDMENNSTKKGSLLENFTDMNQAEIEALKKEYLKNNNSTRIYDLHAKILKDNSYYPKKAPTANISSIQSHLQPSSGSHGAVAQLDDTGRGMSRNISHPEGCLWKNNN